MIMFLIKKALVFISFIVSLLLIVAFIIVFGDRILFFLQFKNAYSEKDFPYVNCSNKDVCVVKKGDFFVTEPFYERTGMIFKAAQAGCLYRGYQNEKIIGNAIEKTSDVVKISIPINITLGCIKYFFKFKAVNVGESKIEYEEAKCLHWEEKSHIIIVE